MEKIIHFSAPKNLSAVQTDAIERARNLHPSWEIKIWQDPVPKDGFLLEGLWSKANSGAQFADLLRLDVVYRWGGVYVDSDVQLLKPLDRLAEQYEFFIASEDGVNLTNAVFGASRSNHVVRRLIDKLVRNEPDWKLPPNVTTGPVFFADNLAGQKGVTILPRESFYTNNWNTVKRSLAHRQAFGDHLWVGSWVPAFSAVSDQKEPILERIKLSIKRPIKRAIRGLAPLAHSDVAPNRISQRDSSEIAVQTSHGFKIVIDDAEFDSAPKVVPDGDCGHAEANFVKKTVRGGDWMIDVGAGIGSATLLAAQQVEQFGRVFAYEPNEKALRLMSKSLVLNGLQDRVIQRQVAVGEAESLSAVRMNQVSDVKAKCVSLDDEFPIDLPIKLLKIDAKGFGVDVLMGANRLLEHKCIDYVMIEMGRHVGDPRRQEAVQRIECLQRLGYVVCTLREDGTVTEHGDPSVALQLANRSILLASQPLDRDLPLASDSSHH